MPPSLEGTKISPRRNSRFGFGKTRSVLKAQVEVAHVATRNFYHEEPKALRFTKKDFILFQGNTSVSLEYSITQKWEKANGGGEIFEKIMGAM